MRHFAEVPDAAEIDRLLVGDSNPRSRIACIAARMSEKEFDEVERVLAGLQRGVAVYVHRYYDEQRDTKWGEWDDSYWDGYVVVFSVDRTADSTAVIMGKSYALPQNEIRFMRIDGDGKEKKEDGGVDRFDFIPELLDVTVGEQSFNFPLRHDVESRAPGDAYDYLFAIPPVA